MMTNHYAALAVLAGLVILLQPEAGAQPPAGAGAADKAVEQQVERAQRQAERAQRQAERARRQAQRIQDQAADRAQRQAERAQSQAAGRARNRAASVRGDGGALPQQAADQARENARRGLDQAERAANPGADLPDRLAVPGRDGGQALVEVAIEPGIRVLEREWVMLLTRAQREQLESEASELMRFLTDTRPFNALDGQLLKFRVPPELDTDDAIRDLVPESLRDRIDRNHVYSAPAAEGRRDQERVDPKDRLPLPMAAICTDELSVGMVDSSIKTDHPAFGHVPATRLISRDFLEAEVEASLAHGTAVAGILGGRGPTLNPLLPGGTIYNASAFYARDDEEGHQGASVMALLEALDWLIAQDLTVINMSLSGPDNRLLEQGINAASANGKVIVAAAGNNGPHAPTRYPAAYDGVIAATAASRDRTVYRWANQGEHIDFTALGVGIPTAVADDGFGRESGTSMATPVVSAFLACSLAGNDNGVDLALSELKSRAVDLGDPGHDPVFGHGLLHPRDSE